MQNVRIAEMCSSDAVKVARLLEGRRGGRLPGPARIGNDKVRAAERALSHNGFWMLAAEVDSGLIGYLTACLIPKADPRGGTLYIDEIWVLPDWRRRGVARRLMEGAMRIAERENLWQVRLTVREDDARARQLYLQAGFSESPCLFCRREVMGDGSGKDQEDPTN